MKIDRHRQSNKSPETIRQALDQLLVPKGSRTAPCQAACQVDPQDCSRHCSGIPTAMSSQPNEYPIEEKIAALVYELGRIGVFQPCWSCEGHLDSNGVLWKLPQIWFYADADLHVRLLADCLRMMAANRITAAEWEIALTRSALDDPETTYCLKPVIQKDTTLPLLQSDIVKLSEQLETKLVEAAQLFKQRCV